MCERLCGKKVQKMLTRKQKEREKDIYKQTNRVEKITYLKARLPN